MRSGVLSYVLPVRIGEATIVRDVSEAELLAAAGAMVARMSQHASTASPVTQAAVVPRVGSPS